LGERVGAMTIAGSPTLDQAVLKLRAVGGGGEGNGAVPSGRSPSPNADMPEGTSPKADPVPAVA
jgi:hypothetical protein